MPYVPPELREHRGELQAAREGELPELVELTTSAATSTCTPRLGRAGNDRGDGARGAERGYEYLAITDHSATHGFGNDVTPDELRRQIERIRGRRRMTGSVLAGTETNVLPDGSVDYEDDLLEQLDWVVASVHTSFGMSEREMTERMVPAMEHPLVDVIGHPTGRLIGRREPYAIDIDSVIGGGRDRHVPRDQRQPGPARPERHLRPRGRGGGRDVAIDSDAHRPTPSPTCATGSPRRAAAG